MAHFQKNMQQHDAAFFQGSIYFIPFRNGHLFAGQEFAADGKRLDLTEMVQPACHEIHGCGRGPVLAKFARFIISIHTIEHNKLNDIRKDFFPVK